MAHGDVSELSLTSFLLLCVVIFSLIGIVAAGSENDEDYLKRARSSLHSRMVAAYGKKKVPTMLP